MDSKKIGNIVLFPNLAEKYIDLAHAASNSGDYEKARGYLEQALSLEPDHPSIMYNLLLVYNDLGWYLRASNLAVSMLARGIGESVEILNQYVISLVKLEKYEEAKDILTNVLTQETVPEALQQSFQKILLQCRLMIDANQAKADKETILHEQVKQLEHEKLQIAELVIDKTYHDDPTFVSFSLHIWLDFLNACTPSDLSLKHPESWAAALHYATFKALDINCSQKGIAAKYGTSVSTMMKKYSVLIDKLRVQKPKNKPSFTE